MPTYPDVPCFPYTTVRPWIQSGDILLCSGSSAWSRLIQRATDSVFSHVALLMWSRYLDRLIVFESVESIGVWNIPVSQYITDSRGTGKPYPGRLFVARHPAITKATAGDWRSLGQFAHDRCGTLYDKQQLGWIALALKAPWLIDAPDQPEDLREARRLICSEFLSACVQCLSVTTPWNARGFVAPDDWAQPPVEMLYEIDTIIPPGHGNA